MKRVVFKRDAAIELEKARLHYERHVPGKGDELVEIAHAAVERIVRMPQMYRAVFHECRRCLLPGFPYHLIYAERDDCIEILAIVHAARDPRRWQSRMD